MSLVGSISLLAFSGESLFAKPIDGFSLVDTPAKPKDAVGIGFLAF